MNLSRTPVEIRESWQSDSEISRLDPSGLKNIYVLDLNIFATRRFDAAATPRYSYLVLYEKRFDGQLPKLTCPLCSYVCPRLRLLVRLLPHGDVYAIYMRPGRPS